MKLIWTLMGSYGLLWAQSQWVSTTHEEEWHKKLSKTLMVSFGLIWTPMGSRQMNYFNIIYETMTYKSQMDSHGLIWTLMG